MSRDKWSDPARILDMMRTTVNVFGDTTAAVIIAASEGEKMYPRVAA